MNSVRARTFACVTTLLLRDNLTVHAAVGKSVRDGNRGGPDLRVYAGLKCEFGAPWKR